MTEDLMTKVWEAFHGGDPMDRDNNTEAGLKRVVEAVLGYVDASSVSAHKRVVLPPVGEELYEFYPSMSAPTHADLVKDYAREAVKIALHTERQP